MNKRKIIRGAFREWWNGYLTVQRFADHYGISRDQALRIINIGRKLHNQRAARLERLLT